MASKPANGRPTVSNVHEELLRHVETALRALRSRKPNDEQIHNARKELKRARADLRLLRDAIGRSAYARENAALRDAARPLSGVRDAKVLVETSETMLDNVSRGAQRTLLQKARQALEKARREARAELRVMNAAKDSAESLGAASGRMRKWHLKRADDSVLLQGLKRTYRRGRKAFAVAQTESTPENLHEWRKQVKYLEQSMQVWTSHDVGRLKALRKRADRLAEMLGADHDLVVFGERLEKLDAPSEARPHLTRVIAVHRQKLQRKALEEGRRVFSAKPRAFTRRVACRE